MKGLWNIALDHHKAIANDFELSMNNAMHAILTGPNKSGKSSMLKAIGLNILLAQTYGIAAAQSMEMTLFSKLISHITVLDDISKDTSMMVAEIMRVERCMQLLNQLDDNEYACVLVDDSLFKGTSFQKGQELGFEFIKGLGDIPGCSSLTATHMPLLTTLATQGNFKNYCIDIAVTQNGKSVSTFTLKEGIANPELVFDIVQSLSK